MYRHDINFMSVHSNTGTVCSLLVHSNMSNEIISVHILKLGPPKQWKPIRWYMPTFFLNLANQKSYLQIQPIKCPAQNKISTSTLWCLCDYHVAYQEIVKLKPLVLFACLNWIICCTFYGVTGWCRKYIKRKAT